MLFHSRLLAAFVCNAPPLGFVVHLRMCVVQAVVLAAASTAVSTVAPSRRPVVGDSVCLTAGFASCGDASDGPLTVGGPHGELLEDDGSDKPFRVKAADGRNWWWVCTVRVCWAKVALAPVASWRFTYIEQEYCCVSFNRYRSGLGVTRPLRSGTRPALFSWPVRQLLLYLWQPRQSCLVAGPRWAMQ
jgi:hypothetical protein